MDEINIFLVKQEAKAKFIKQWGVAVLAIVFIGFFDLINETISLISNIASDKQMYIEMIGEAAYEVIVGFYVEYGTILLIISLAIGLFLTIIEFGKCKLFLDVAEEKEAGFASIFDGFLYPVKAVFANIYMTVLIILWSFLFIIPGFVAAIKYSMTYYIIAENPQMPITDAVDLSKHMMMGHKMEYFIMLLSFLPWMLVIAFTFGVAGFYVNPYMETSYANFYIKVRDRYMAKQTA